MSIEARQQLCNRLIFQDDTQRADLMDPSKTQTNLIALLLDLSQTFPIEITAVRSDHHDDSALGLNCHANGYAVDCWPLQTNQPGNYYDAENPHFLDFLTVAAQSPWCYQIGLAGSAQTDAAVKASKGKSFMDDGADHIHLGAIA